MIIVDAKDQILGRLATRVAKFALNGEPVRVINCGQAIITGRKEVVLEKFKQKVSRGVPLRGPYYPRQSDKIVRRTIRGMLPYKQERGATAYKNVLCFVGVPADFQGKETISFPDAAVTATNAKSYVYVGEISKLIGGSR
jgi:large subunit ribosomal protein L13